MNFRKLLMAFLLALLLLMAALECAWSADKWTKEDIAEEITFQVVNAIDTFQTVKIAKNPDQYYERNPLFGEHPSVEKVYLIKTGFAVGHLLVTHYLPQKYRRIWCLGTTAVLTPIVMNNFNIGLGIGAVW
jgi:hypothetical protein